MQQGLYIRVKKNSFKRKYFVVFDNIVNNITSKSVNANFILCDFINNLFFFFIVNAQVTTDNTNEIEPIIMGKCTGQIKYFNHTTDKAMQLIK